LRRNKGGDGEVLRLPVPCVSNPSSVETQGLTTKKKKQRRRKQKQTKKKRKKEWKLCRGRFGGV
jgi:hypothetical protein